MNEVKSLLGTRSDEESGDFDVASVCPSLSYKQRIWGFIICFGLGFILGFFGAWLLFVDIIAFAVLYTLGNILSLGSTMFLVGPLRQIKLMFELKRIVATLIYLGAMAMTLFSALYFKDESAKVGLTLLFLIIQWLALIWYCLSYIPFAHKAIMNCCRSLCS